MKVVFLANAYQELNDAIAFYEDQLPGLGEIFYKEVNETIDLICLYPHGWQLVTKLTHKCPLHKFPYLILYGVIDNVIVVSCIAHQHRHPKFYLRD